MLLLLAVAIFATPQTLVVTELPLVFVPPMSAAGIRFDLTDVLLGLLAISLIVRRHSLPLLGKDKVPYAKSWLVLGLLMSASYLLADINQQYLTGIARAGYQVYRYCWKELLYFPIGAVLFKQITTVKSASNAIILAGIIIGGFGTIQGYTSGIGEARTFFGTGNAMGAALLAPLTLAYVSALVPRSRREMIVSSVAVVLILRALLFTGSRGAFASALAAGLFCSVWLWLSRPAVRTRLLRLIPIALIGIATLLVIKPDVMDRPAVSRAMTAFEGSKARTMQWRITQRWPHFWDLAKQQPWLGYATPVDMSLGKAANTPHNGFLALAVAHGIPAALLFVLFGVRAIRNGLFVMRYSEDLDYAMIGLSIAGFVTGLMVNSILESTIRIQFIAKVFWLLSGIVSIAVYQIRYGTQPDEESVESPSNAAQAANAR